MEINKKDSWFAVIALVAITSILLWDMVQKDKRLLEFDKGVDELSCDELRMYVANPNVIRVANGQTGPFAFCEDLLIESERNACLIMEKENWEYANEAEINLQYKERCQ